MSELSDRCALLERVIAGSGIPVISTLAGIHQEIRYAVDAPPGEMNPSIQRFIEHDILERRVERQIKGKGGWFDW